MFLEKSSENLSRESYIIVSTCESLDLSFEIDRGFGITSKVDIFTVIQQWCHLVVIYQLKLVSETLLRFAWLVPALYHFHIHFLLGYRLQGEYLIQLLRPITLDSCSIKFMWSHSDTISVLYSDFWPVFSMLQHSQRCKACGPSGHQSKKNPVLFVLILWVCLQDLFWFHSLVESLVVLSDGKVCFTLVEWLILYVVFAGTFSSGKTQNLIRSYRTMNGITFWRID